MPTFNSSQYQRAYVNVPSDKIGRGEHNSPAKLLFFSYTVVSATANADILKLCKLPKGARVLNAVISHPDMGTAGVANLGWAASEELVAPGGAAVEAASNNGLIASIDLHTAAQIITMHEISGAAPTGLFKQFNAEVDIQLDISTGWTATSGVIQGYIEYVVA